MLLHNYRKLNIQRHQYARRADVVFADSVVGEKNLFVCVGLWLMLSFHKGLPIWQKNISLSSLR